ncbi:myelin-associated glycoprotein-like [Chanodichthys erythropterus]|uniref:myelin-associated glycoprotein-like n=1 Tax=Chanodichthys erythropterus TaxID=933992 RepID=UPI00351DB384
MNTVEKTIIFSFLLQGVCSRPFSISLTEKIEALSGSSVIIKCTFEIKDEYVKELTESDATGLWLKDGYNVNNHLVFNSRDSKPDHFKGEITGKLHEKNCTTIFYNVSSNHNGKYYFRIESGGLKYTYSERENISTINVIESPPKPTVKLYEEQKEVQDQEEVLEGSSVSLRCSAETLCSSPPPTLTWSSTPRIPLSESSRRQELISDLNFTAAHRHHRVTFTCTITYQILDKNKTAQNNITLHVQYAPQISTSSSCVSGDVTECFCKVDGNPSPELEWHLSGRPVTNSSDTFISEERLSSTVLRSSITLHQSLTHTSLQCIGNNTRGTAGKLLQLNLSPLQCTEYQQVSLLIILMLILVLYALTVGLGIYKIRQLSTKLKAQNEAADTYASLQVSPQTHSEAVCGSGSGGGVGEELYAPQISTSSSCVSGNVIECFCEVDGNPSPELEWHLSGRPVTNSSDTFISEERFSSTVLRSSITLHQSLTHTSLQCVGNNTRGTERKQFELYLFSQEASWFNICSFLIGVGSVMVMVMCYNADLQVSRPFDCME